MAKVKKELDAKDKRTGILTVAVITFLIAIFVVGFIYGLNSVLAMEGAYPPNVLADSELALYDSVIDKTEFEAFAATEKKLAYNALTNAIADAKESKEPAASTSRNDKIMKDENGYIISTTGSEELITSLKLLAEDTDNGGTDLGKAVKSDFTQVNASYAEDISGILAKPAFSLNDIRDYTCSYQYYQCPSCDEIDGETCYEACPKCGSTAGYQLKYQNDFSICFTLNNDQTVLNKCFAPRTQEQIIALFGDSLNGKVQIQSVQVTYNNLSVSFVLERTTLHLKRISYIKQATVEAQLLFIGDFAELGEQTVTFDIEQNDSVNLTWPGISLNQHEMSIEPKGEDNLLATLTCEAPTDMTVVWSTDNADIVSVDDEGYMKACKTDGQDAVITASYEYNGKTYSDSCTVHVRYPVESTSMSKSKAKLKAGETLSLTVKFSPKNATVKTVTWYSTNESVATVDENGTVTAVEAGEATVYSLSDDGFFKSSCQITVQ